MRGTNKRMGGKPQAQENKSRTIQANKTLEKSDRVLTAAIRRCHIELAKRTSLSDIEASKGAVEAAWEEFTHASTKYCVRTGENLFGKEEELSEEARRVRYEWIALLNMMEQVVEKAEEYLESATKENSCGESNDDGDDGGELDADGARRVIEAWMEQLSTMSKVNEMALELSAANKVNANEVNVMNKVNEENEVNVNVKDDNKVKVFDARVNNGKVGLRLYDKKAEAKQSCPANWNPGELPDAKDQVEMLDVEEVANLVNNDKVARTGGEKSMMFFYALYSLTLYTSDALVALCMARFVNGFRRECPIELSDYG